MRKDSLHTQVRKDSLNHEFFERHFVPGIHYAAVDTVDEIPDMIRRLQADPRRKPLHNPQTAGRS